jgi:hypothetical protein
MSDPQTDCEMLLGALMPFAEQMLTEHGEFYPFAATMSPEGECSMVGFEDEENDEPEPAELIAIFTEQFRREASFGEFKATAIVYNGVTVPPGKAVEQDTVICAVDHRDGFSAKVCFPYSIDDEGQVEIEDPFAAAGENKIFSVK